MVRAKSSTNNKTGGILSERLPPLRIPGREPEQKKEGASSRMVCIKEGND